LFRLPFFSFLADWLFGALVVVTLATTAAHFLFGGVRLPIEGNTARRGTVSGAVKAHVSVLLAAVALVKP
jgi:uncharacterized membrane protein (UPF0182 family)